ncbi:uncharacterized protein L969DRAFT_90093 [Mixia osmundae IAM 14324]|uniref:uncharacterized protein n=1 Tax=Mixia osmundae (strain CBS 9802 / IAM 14324 / JCM 22182 / KY 12970) TaxID=764103 RepID=UPI0004A55702|nr:uncharacterized protein L969DRAFT_90093 [Mixia osmundae IAM 14324]KEI37030.1 hypothetical protein L969DRAFT_90093 [Mixia osmundae IAM 14324]
MHFHLLGLVPVICSLSFVHANARLQHRHTHGKRQANSINVDVNVDGLATFRGSLNPKGVETFHSIPYVEKPGRLEAPRTLKGPLVPAFRSATTQAPACPQLDTPMSSEITPAIKQQIGQELGILGLETAVAGLSRAPTSEDCLYLSIYRPKGTTATDRLPVLVWYHGGGYTTGSSALYDGSDIVAMSVRLGTPIAVVVPNYRLGAYGFLAGQQMQDALLSNLGFMDQRMALFWIAYHSRSFGIDPFKVTISGQSAGAASVGYHTLFANGRTAYLSHLFRATIEQSGDPSYFIGTMTDGQASFDTLAHACGCGHAKDPIACLRAVPADQYAASTRYLGRVAYNSNLKPFGIKMDNRWLTSTATKALHDGLFSHVPSISGSATDEGTLPALNSAYIATKAASFAVWVSAFFGNKLTAEESDNVARLYPDEQANGSPYDSGSMPVVNPLFKRVASFLGDYSVQSSRRRFAEARVAQNVPTYTYQWNATRVLPVLGACHASDVPAWWYESWDKTGMGAAMRQYFVSFVATLNPNPVKPVTPLPHWQPRGQGGEQILFDSDKVVAGNDNYRKTQIDYLIQLQDSHYS